MTDKNVTDKYVVPNDISSGESAHSVDNTYLACNEELFWRELKVLAEDSLQRNE